MPRVSLDEVAKWLLNAPKIARDTAPFFWTYLDKPENGQVYLTWQPLSTMGPEFASDGYMWPPAEQYFQQQLPNGLVSAAVPSTLRMPKQQRV